jgi:hypothetical protein
MYMNIVCVYLIKMVKVSHFLATAFLSTPLMTPTATVYFMSLTANLPRGGYSLKISTHIGLVGIKVTIAASPVLMNLGSSSNSLPVLLSILEWISWNLQAMWEVWQSKTGQ